MSATKKTTTTPIPGTKVRGSRTGRPIMALLDLLGRRWSLRVLWELREASATFRELRDRCDGVSPTVLNDRLRELREAGIVELREDAGYATTTHGAALVRALEPMHDWAVAWGRRTREARSGE
jgi:DNA-binding HxlR family transcriptional regulator